MTRTEEIEKEAIDYSEIEDNFMEYDDCGDVCDDRELVGKAFVQGAKWADETIIRKACRYLDANFPEIDSVGTWYKKSFIEEFKKAMEE